MTPSTTTTLHLRVSEAEQATPATRVAPTGATGATGYAFENELAPELEDLAVGRLRNPGGFVDATEVLPELAE
jgi:hypothetical protein